MSKEFVGFSSMISRPVGQNCESSDPIMEDFITEQGGYIHYAHPEWIHSWGGNLKFKDCDIVSYNLTK